MKLFASDDHLHLDPEDMVSGMSEVEIEATFNEATFNEATFNSDLALYLWKSTLPECRFTSPEDQADHDAWLASMYAEELRTKAERLELARAELRRLGVGVEQTDSESVIISYVIHLTSLPRGSIGLDEAVIAARAWCDRQRIICLAKAEPGRTEVPPVNEQPPPAPVMLPELLSSKDLAKAIGEDAARVRNKLERYAKKYPDCRTSNDAPRRGEPRFMYRTADVIHLFRARQKCA